MLWICACGCKGLQRPAISELELTGSRELPNWGSLGSRGTLNYWAISLQYPTACLKYFSPAWRFEPVTPALGKHSQDLEWGHHWLQKEFQATRWAGGEEEFLKREKKFCSPREAEHKLLSWDPVTSRHSQAGTHMTPTKLLLGSLSHPFFPRFKD